MRTVASDGRYARLYDVETGARPSLGLMVGKGKEESGTG